MLLFLMDLGATHGVPADSSPVFFFPHAGVTMVTSGQTSGTGSGGAAVGYHLGAGMLIHLSPHFGIRADYTYRHLLNFESTWSSITGTLMYMH